MEDALTFDTQTIMSKSYDFDGAILGQLKQFQNGPVRVLVSSVIVREIEKHLVAATEKARETLIKAQRDAAHFGLTQEDKSTVAGVDPVQIAKGRLQKYLTDIGAVVIDTDGVTLEEVLGAYFSISAPFSKDKSKSKEFPDAIALMSIEKWAAQYEVDVLAISGDGDWERFAEKSQWISHVPDYVAALQKYQTHIDEARAFVGQFAEALALPDDDTVERLRDLLESAVASIEFDIDADSRFYVENNGVSVSLDGFSLPEGFSAESDAKFLAVKDTFLAVEMPIEVRMNLEIDLSYSIYDGADKEMIRMGSATLSQFHEITETFVLVFSQVWKSGQIDLLSISKSGGSVTLGLGDVDAEFDEEFAAD